MMGNDVAINDDQMLDMEIESDLRSLSLGEETTSDPTPAAHEEGGGGGGEM